MSQDCLICYDIGLYSSDIVLTLALATQLALTLAIALVTILSLTLAFALVTVLAIALVTFLVLTLAIALATALAIALVSVLVSLIHCLTTLLALNVALGGGGVCGVEALTHLY